MRRLRVLDQRWFTLGIVALLLSLLPSAAHADCKQWDASGTWIAQQSNRHDVEFKLTQNGTQLKGTVREVRDKALIVVDGTIIGNAFSITVNWSGGPIGVYRGLVASDGMLKGTTYDRNNPDSRARWVSSRPMTCADAPAPPPPPVLAERPGRPVGKTGGKPRPPQQQGVPTNPATAGAPMITANPTTVSIPAGQRGGTTTLTWDGGKDHPYAEVWVKEDDGEETFVVEQAKGTRQVNVRPGRTYLYILTNSGRRLATVTVRATER